ncbi:killer cell lectin-like receptor subfamily B member 1B allele A isoform X2 [Corvus kubaryi]|uniref:killer cell lectin-like receptor subfamily B member 1B allele A isoform X2 n=1 Tax=Corvus kubaryi TaxID=68294 RepID=UPI001C056E8D|nr:killer cell lectin-like receptor subfamily B member 1B allele A isoform X2 [Corvus kubaryi]
MKEESGTRMAENVLYADLNLSESTRPRILKVPDVPGCTYAEVKVKSQDANDTTNFESSRKSCRCSRRLLAVLAALLVVAVLALTLCWTLLYGATAGSQEDSTTTIPEKALEPKGKDWNVSRDECAALGSELVIIDSTEELNYLLSRSKQNYYLLGLRFSQEEEKWKWPNNVEHDPAMFNITGKYHDYLCTAIGFGQVHTAPCYVSPTTQNMCEKAATVSARLQKES